MSVAEKIASPGPKKLLALDGGGIRGVISLGVLAEIESTLRTALGKDKEFVLADYFDYIAGTSTGGIIAALLSIGKRVAEIQAFYDIHGKAMFDRASFLEITHYNYSSWPLSKQLQDIFGADATLASDTIRTLLMLVMSNASTDSPWPISNNPRAKYNDALRRTGPQQDCNLDMPLWQLVRASTAAPVYFPPEQIAVGKQTFVFVDGGVTTANNPALQLFLMATLEPYRLCWPTGADQMLLVSVGTGTEDKYRPSLKPSDMHLVYSATNVPGQLMHAASAQQDTLCRVLGRCRVGGQIDREVGSLMNLAGPVAPLLFTYLRYDVELSRKGLDALDLQDIEPSHVAKMDSVGHIKDLGRVGAALGKQRVRREHFEGFVS